MNLLDIILESIDEALVILDPDGQVLLFNQKVNEIHNQFGWTHLKTGESIFNALPGDAYHRVSETLLELKLKKNPIRFYADRIGIDGNRVYVETTYMPVIQDGVLTHINVLIRDITVNKVFENRLTNIASNLTSLIERANAVIIGVDSRGYITEWNRHASDVLGYSKNNVFTQKLSDVLLYPEDIERYDQIMAAALQNKSTLNFELNVKSMAGEKITLLLSASPRFTSANAIIGVIFVGQDISELISYRESLEKVIEQRTQELRQSIEKEKEALNVRARFVSMVSHEFRTPLASIGFSAGYLKKFKERLTPDALDEKLNQILKQVDHMTHMMEDILTIGKADNNRIKTSATPINLREYLHDLVRQVHEATGKTHTVNLQIDFRDTHLNSDEKLLRNILINLLTNAIKFSPGKSHVELQVGKEGNAILFEVRDYGLGIPPDELEKIFEPFHRSSQVNAIPGAGLGLSIVKRAVDLLKGVLTLDSEPGKGTTFTIKLPLEE